MDLPLEGRISGPSTGFEVTVPGRQGIRAMRNSIPLAGAPTSIETSLRGLLFFCSARFLLVVSRKAACPAHQMVAVFRRRAVPGPVLAISEQPAPRLVVSIALLGEEDAPSEVSFSRASVDQTDARNALPSAHRTSPSPVTCHG